jgi:hypothetical protein
MKFSSILAGLATFAALSAGTAGAQQDVPKIGYNEQHVQRWNAFVDKLYALHLQQIAGIEVQANKTTGGYNRFPDFYDEVEYVDAATGRVLSRILWQRNLGGAPDSATAVTPEQAVGRIHNIEVFIHGADGKVSRDYSATYLPDFRNAPIQTLISLHNYNGGLHAFRVFDASGVRIFEVCRDDGNGGKELVSFNEDQMNEARADPNSVMYGDDYKACFDGLGTTVGEYISPH